MSTKRGQPHNHAKIEGLIRRAGLRCPDADLRRVDLVEERGLDRQVIAQLATCSFIARQQSVVFQGFTGSGKSDLEAAWALASDKPQAVTKFPERYAAFPLLVVDEWLLDHPDDAQHAARAAGTQVRHRLNGSAPSTPRRTGTSASDPECAR